MNYKPGSRWKSTVCSTEVVVVRPPSSAATFECGGATMVSINDQSGSDATLSPEFSEGSQVGKRYFDEQSGIELLCTKSGQGSLAVDGRRLQQREAKKLPSSD